MLRVLAIPVLALGLGSRHKCVAAPLRAEDLFRASELNDARFSPDGRYLGTIVTDEEDQRNLLIFDTKEHKPLGLRASGAFEVSTFHWLGSDGVVFSVLKDRFYSRGLYSAKLGDLGRYKPINLYDVTRIVGLPESRPGHVLVWIVRPSIKDNSPVRLVELNAGRYTSPFESYQTADAVVRTYHPPPEGPATGWAVDRNGELALCQIWADAKTQVYHYLPASDSWKKAKQPDGAQPMGVDYESQCLWDVTVSPTGTYELRRLNMDTGWMDPTVLSDSSYDIGTGRLYFSERQHALAGVRYLRVRPFTVWFLRAFAVAQATVDKVWPRTENILVANDSAESKFLFACEDSQHPATYELLDLGARSLRTFSKAAPWLEGKPMRPVVPMSFQTRDGVKLEGYETFPEGASLGHPVPLVVLPHGGPWLRDSGMFNPEVQFLASRGYAVLQPNYRGSAGYSPTISHDDEYDFHRMHDDVTDATRAMLATGLVDARRVGIMGRDFGGYLAVAGVAFEKDLYKCAITQFGIFDWEKLIRSKRDNGWPGEYERLSEKLGMPGPDSARLRDISPLEHVDRIHVPVLIAHGTDDNIVDVAQSKKLARALGQRGVPCETFFRDNEGHGFNNYSNRVEFYHRVEAFLAANLGGETLTPPK
jgi:dipeptidyl aminopeptidase/acylaminoacyl peptidase